MKNSTLRLLLIGFVLVLGCSYSYAQTPPTITSVTGRLVRTTPRLADIDRRSMYGIPLKKTRDKEELVGVVDIERAEESVFKNLFPDNSGGNRLQNNSPADNSYLASIASSTNINMNGQTFPGFAPSDNNMAVGPNHIIQIINHSSGSAFKIWNKAGTQVQASVVLSSLTGLSGSGDPVVVYDQLANRWVLTEFGKTGNINYINTLIVAVSTTGDPTGTWKVYSYNVGTFFVDYPKYAVWQNAYYATSNDFNTSGTSYLGSSIYAFDRNAMLAGVATATMIRSRFTGSGSRYYSMAPVCIEGTNTSNQSGLFAFLQDNTWVGAPADSLFIFEFTPNFASPASSVIGPFRAMATSPFNTNTGDLAQQGTTQKIQALSQRLMNKVIYRNFGSSESIVCNTTDLQNTRTGVHWWELRRPGSGNWNIYQEGLWQPASDNNHRFMGSIAINANGDIGLLYNVTGSTAFPSARYTARNSCDPLGQMTLPETVVINGTTFESSNNRYGDYNSLSVDPVNGSFWGTAQYNASGFGTYGNWVTRIVNFSITPCGGANAGTVSGTSPLCIGQTATYSTNGDAGGTWSSTNTTVATINASSGLVTAASDGTTNITYTVSGVSAFKTLTVNPNVTAGTVSGTSPLCIGATATYSSNGTAGGTWSSTNTAVATVNASSGLVTTITAGTTNITYTVNSGCGSPVSAFKTLTVNPNVTAGTVSGNPLLCSGAIANYTSDGIAGGTWSSSNTSVATVNTSTGAVTAVAAGTANITYTVNSGCGSPVSSFKTLTVNPDANAGTVSGTSPLTVGQTSTYSSNGDGGGTWSSTNTSVATVNSSTGEVTAVSTGTTDITYTVSSGCNSPVSSFKTLTVGSATNAGTVSGTSPLCIGQTATYSSDGDAGGTWSSTNTSVATVNSVSGEVTAVSAGTSNITYTVSGVSSFKTLTVNPGVTAGTVTGTSPFCIGATTTYTSNGTTGGIWSSDNTSVATVNASSGLVTGVSAGSANITYTVTNSCGEASTSQQIDVTNCADPSITCPSNITSGVTSGCTQSIAVPDPVISNTTTLTWVMTGATTGSSPATGVNNVGTRTFNIGTTTITYTAKNSAGTTATCLFTVTITDNTTASISCPSNITNTQNGLNKCSAVITVPNPNISSNCSVGSLTWVMSGALTGNSPATGINFVGTQTFPVGITTVTYTVTNGANNTATCSFTVTVTNKKCPNSPASPLITAADKDADKIIVTVFPNPSETYFTLLIQSASSEKVEISVYASNGKLVQKMKGDVFETFRFGDTYIPGTYMVKLRQGSKQAIVKVIK